MSEQVILYDLPSAGRCQGWSPNPWKTRMALNFKGISYKTEWVEYPELEPKLKALGIAPNPASSNPYGYSSPAVRMPDGSCIMDSQPIAAALEKLKPTPSLHLDAVDHAKLQDLAIGVMVTLSPLWLSVVHEQILRPGSVQYFKEDRERQLGGMSLRDYEKQHGDGAFKAAEPGMQRLKDELTTHKKDEGPFILGSTPTYGDLVVAALFEGMERVVPKVHERVISFDNSFRELHEACKPWCKRDD